MIGLVAAILMAVVLIAAMGGDFGKSSSDAEGPPAAGARTMETR